MLERSQSTLETEKVDHFFTEAERFFQAEDWEKAIQQYENAFVTLKITDNKKSDEYHRRLALCYQNMGVSYMQLGWDKRGTALNCLIRSIKNINEVNNKEPVDFQQISRNYENLRSLFPLHVPEHELFNLGQYLFSGYTQTTKELFEHTNYMLSRIPTILLAPDILEAWLQLLHLVRFTWKSANFPAECPMHAYLENAENLAIIDRKIAELEKNTLNLTNHISRSSSLLAGIILEIKSKDKEINSLKEKVEQLINKSNAAESKTTSNLSTLKMDDVLFPPKKNKENVLSHSDSCINLRRK